MDHRGFDRLTRKLATGASRRTALKAVAGGALVSALSAFGHDAAAQGVDTASHVQGRCRRAGGKCDGNPDCCGDLVCRNSGGRGGRCRRPRTTII